MRRLLTIILLFGCAAAVIDVYLWAKARTMRGFSPQGTRAARKVSRDSRRSPVQNADSIPAFRDPKAAESRQ